MTFIGERHEFRFRLAGPDAERAFECLACGLEEAEFAIPRQVVAEVSLSGSPEHAPDGSISFGIEALTIEE